MLQFEEVNLENTDFRNSNWPPFAELKMLRFKFMTKNTWNKENTFKKAAKVHAVSGIILSAIWVFLCVFVYFILLLPNVDCQSQPCYLYTASVFPLLACGVLFFFLSIFLLLKINKNDRDGVFRIIKIGCLMLALLDVICAFITMLYEMEALFQDEIIKTDQEPEIIIVVTVSTFQLTMSALVITGIFAGNAAIVTAYIINRYVQSPIVAIVCFFGIYLKISEDFRFDGIVFPLVFGFTWLIFHIVFFALHLNAMLFVQKSQVQAVITT